MIPLAVAGFLLVLVAAPAVLLFQAVLWLWSGTWLHIPVRVIWMVMGWWPPYTEWVGVQKIVDYLLDMPLSVGVFFLGTFLMWLATRFTETQPKPVPVRREY